MTDETFGVSVFVVEMDRVTPASIARCAAVLSDDERAHAARFHFVRDRDLFTVTRGLLRLVLSRFDKARTTASWEFAKGTWGRPEVDDRGFGGGAADGKVRRDGIDFNVSHTDGFAAIVVSRGRLVGVDVEKVSHARPSTLAQTFSREEIALLDAAPAGRRDELFVELWTLKEAYVKARGMGLSLPLDHFTFDLTTPNEIRADLTHVTDRADRWEFQVYRATPQHVLALAIERKRTTPKIDFFDASAIDQQGELSLVAVRSTKGG